MPQRYANLALLSQDLSLADGNHGTSQYFENASVDCGIKTLYGEEKFSKIIEPQRETALEEIIAEIGGLSAVFQYKTFVDGAEKDFLILCSSSFVLYNYELYKEVPELKCFNSISISDVPHFETFSKSDGNLLIISTDQDEMWVWDGSNNPYEVLDSPKISSACIGMGRLFVSTNTRPYSVCYSEDLDPSSWSMSSGDIMEINFADDFGKVLKVVSIDNYVFAIRERGVVKIYSKASGELVTSRALSFAGKIYENSVCECADSVVFCSTAGIYKFDGVNLKLIYKNFDNLLNDFSVQYAICKDNKYHLFLSKNTEASGCVFVVDDTYGKIYDICKIEAFCYAFFVDMASAIYVGYIASVNASKNAKMPIFLTKSSQKTPKQAQFLYKTNKIFMQKCSKATILFADILSKTDIAITFETDHETKQYTLAGGDNLQRIMLNEQASYFAVTISGSSGADIDIFDVRYSYIGD